MINKTFALVIVLALCTALAGAQQAGTDVQGVEKPSAGQQQPPNTVPATQKDTEAPAAVFFCKFKGTKQKYPVVTWGMVALGALFSAATYYHNDQARSFYQEYLAATDDVDILRYREEAERNDKKTVRYSCAATSCFILAVTSYMVRTPVPVGRTSQRTGVRLGLRGLVQTGPCGGPGVLLSLEVRP